MMDTLDYRKASRTPRRPLPRWLAGSVCITAAAALVIWIMAAQYTAAKRSAEDAKRQAELEIQFVKAQAKLRADTDEMRRQAQEQIRETRLETKSYDRAGLTPDEAAELASLKAKRIRREDDERTKRVIRDAINEANRDKSR